MAICKDEIISLLYKQGSPSEDTNLWEEFSAGLPEDLCMDILAVLRKDPANIRTMTDSLKEKAVALAEGDLKKWEEIMKKEKDFLLSLQV